MVSYSCGWHGPLEAFLCVDERNWESHLLLHHQSCALEPAADSQRCAWHNCFLALREQLRDLGDAYIIFEYELPRERGRRPDVVILICGTVLVLEFKDHRTAHRAHIDQVAAYARDLRHYHAASHLAAVVPVLVLTGSLDPPTTFEDVTVVGPKDLSAAIARIIGADKGTAIIP